MIVGVPTESLPDEHRVAIIPAAVPALIETGLDVLVQKGAGEKAGFADAEYQKHGARLAPDRVQLFSSTDVLLKVHNLTTEGEDSEINMLHAGQTLIGLLNPLGDPTTIEQLAVKHRIHFAIKGKIEQPVEGVLPACGGKLTNGFLNQILMPTFNHTDDC